jgi:hypothetical protein
VGDILRRMAEGARGAGGRSGLEVGIRKLRLQFNPFRRQFAHDGLVSSHCIHDQ